MTCKCKRVVPLVKNQSLSSAPDGSAKVYWSAPLDFASAAIYFRALILYANNVEVRVRGRCSIDEVTYTDANPGETPATSGYIDGLSAAWDAAGFYFFQYLGTPEEHTAFFQIGIEVSGTAGSDAVGTVTLSASASFGEAQPIAVDLGATAGTLATATVPAVVPGARTVYTGGFARVRVALSFGAVPGQTVTLYLASGPEANQLAVDQQSTATTTSSTLSFVVEAPDAWSTVYYSVTAGTTGAVTGLSLTLLP